MTIATRRAMLTGSAAMVVASPALAAPVQAHPDAELIAIGIEAERLIPEYQRFRAMFLAEPKGSPRLSAVADLADPSYDRLDELTEMALGLTATTMAGVRAKALLMGHQLRDQYSRHGVFHSKGEALDLAMSIADDMQGTSRRGTEIGT